MASHYILQSWVLNSTIGTDCYNFFHIVSLISWCEYYIMSFSYIRQFAFHAHMHKSSVCPVLTSEQLLQQLTERR